MIYLSSALTWIIIIHSSDPGLNQIRHRKLVNQICFLSKRCVYKRSPWRAHLPLYPVSNTRLLSSSVFCFPATFTLLFGGVPFFFLVLVTRENNRFGTAVTVRPLKIPKTNSKRLIFASTLLDLIWIRIT